MTRIRLFALLGALLFVGCGDDGDATVDAGETPSMDAGLDASRPDEDAAIPPDDASTSGDDAAVPGDEDAATPTEDAAVPTEDASTPDDDAAVPGDEDAGRPDAGRPDAGPVDAGRPDAGGSVTIGPVQCFDNSECGGPATCNRNAPGGICNGCGNDAHCPRGTFCGDFGACIRDCDSDSDCHPAFRCLGSGQCALRTCASGCPAPYVCGTGTTCVRPSCDDSTPCPSPLGCERGVCVER